MLSLILLRAVPAFTQGAAARIYVASDGKDSNIGTSAEPLATLAKARDLSRVIRGRQTVKAPIEILVKQGSYFLPAPVVFDARDMATKEAPLTVRGYGKGRPVFTGGYAVKNFVKVSDKLWKAEIPEVARSGVRFQQLYVNGTRATRARTPNTGVFHPQGVEETILVQGPGRVALSASQKISLGQNEFQWLSAVPEADRGEVLLKFYHNWDNTIRPVQSIDTTNKSVTMTGLGMKSWNKIRKESLLVFENSKTFIDEPGEWYLSREGTLYYYPRENERIETVQCVAPVTEKLILIGGVSGASAKPSFISFENISFQGAAFNLPKNGFEPSQAASQVGAAIEIDFASDITFRGCEVAHTGANAIWFRRSCSNGLLERSYLHDLGAGGVKIGETTIKGNEVTHHIRVENNIIQSGGHFLPCAVGLAIFSARDNIVSHNDISDFRYTGISVGWVYGYGASPAKSNLITFNHIHHLGWGLLSDMAGVYTLGPSEGTVISNNVVHDVMVSEYGGWGLYADEGSTAIVFENNLVYRCQTACFHQHFGRDNQVRNNIFALGNQAQLQLSRVEPHRSLSFTHNIIYSTRDNLFATNWASAEIKSDSNCYWVQNAGDLKFGNTNFKGWQKMGRDSGSVVTDPGFIDPQNFNFRIKNLRAVQAIKFRPFDYTQAGVTGSAEWKRLAKLPKSVTDKFDSLMQQR